MTTHTPTPAEERGREYREFTVQITRLCRVPGTRRALQQLRGRELEQLDNVPGELRHLTWGRPARRAYFTVATLIALTSPTVLADMDDPDDTDALCTAVDADPAGTTDDLADATLVTGAALTLTEPGQRSTPSAEALREGAAPPAPGAAPWQRPNLGVALAHAVQRAVWNRERTDRDLRLLARVSDDELHRRLPRLVKRLLGDNVAIDWPVLLEDLIRRDYDRGRIRSEWQDGFHLTLPDDAKDTTR